MSPLPAHKTKHHPTLHHHLQGREPATLLLTQCSSNGTTTGTTLWLGAQVLAYYLRATAATLPPLPGRAVELGAGVGLPSLVLACLGYHVVATDLEVVVAGVLRENVEVNWEVVGGRVGVRVLDWRGYSVGGGGGGGEGIEGGGVDLVVTADTVYEIGLVRPLVETIKGISRAGRKEGRCPLVLIAWEVRDRGVIDAALDVAKELGFECRKVSSGRVKKCLDSCGVRWDKEDWAGVEIWRWRYKGS